MKRIFVTHSLPPNSQNIKGLSRAASNFSYNLIDSGLFDSILITLPSFVKRTPTGISLNENVTLIFSELLRKHRVLNKLSILIEQFVALKFVPRKSSIWFYNLGYLNFILFILLRVFKPSVKLYVIMLDFVPPRRRLSFESLFLWLLNSSNGIIELAKSDLFTCENSTCIAGITPLIKPDYPKVDSIKPVFLLSGALYEYISNITLLLKTFSQLPKCTLHITGYGGNDELIESYAKCHSNIIYHKYLSNEDYNNLLRESTFLLSTRQSSYPDNECNFPSKIIEGLMANRIIISTINYPQLEEIAYMQVSENPNTLYKELYAICNLSNSELNNYANQADKTYAKFNPVKWASIIQQIESNQI